MTGYTLTQAADADLEQIGRYTEKRWGLAQAEHYLLAFEAAFINLTLYPDTGRPVPDRVGYLRIECGSHVVFYRKQTTGVLIVRVLHLRMEPRRHLPGR